MPRPKVKRPPNPHYKLAKLIIDKFVDARVTKGKGIAKELVLAYKLTKKYDSAEFWRGLPCLHKVKSMIVFFGEAAKKKLKWQWDVYREKIATDRKIKVPKFEKEVKIAPAKQSEYKEVVTIPKTVFDFCRK